MPGWIILVLLLSSANDEKLAFQISHLGKKELIFESQEDCSEHVKKNSISIMAFTLSQYGPDKYIDKIVCVRNDKEATI